MKHGIVIALVLVGMVGCKAERPAPRPARFEFHFEASSVWRLDTQTGRVDACSVIDGKRVCTEVMPAAVPDY